MSTRILNAQGVLSSDVPTGNLLWADSVNGVDALAARGRLTIPFKTLTAAKNAAKSGDTIIVLPGTYDENNLLKHGVNWHFLAGAKVIYSGSGDAGIFDTSSNGTNGAVTSMITGFGHFQVAGSNTSSVCHAVYSFASNSDLVIHAHRLLSNNASCVKTGNGAGKLMVHVADEIRSSTAKAVEIGGTASSSNENIVHARKLHSSGAPGLYVSGGNLDLETQYISSTAATAVYIAGGSGSRINIRALEILPPAVASTFGVHYSASSNPLLTIIGARILGNYNDAGGHAFNISVGGSNSIKLAGCVLISVHASSNSIAASASTNVQFHGLSVGKRVNTNITPVPSGAWIQDSNIT